MALLCSVLGHMPGTTRHRHRGTELAVCHHCDCNLVRHSDGEWQPLKGLFAVPSPASRDLDSAHPALATEKQGRPLAGTAALFGALARITRLVENDAGDEARAAGREHVIRLPHRHAKGG